MRQIKSKWLIACLVMILAVSSLAMGEDAAEAEMIPLSVRGYELVFQGPLTEGIVWQEIPETEAADIRFCMPVRGEVDVPLFIMTLEQSTGDYAKVLKDAAGNEVPVGFHVAQCPPGLTDEERWAFAWAQADLFVVMESLQVTALPEEMVAAVQEEPFCIVTDAFELTYSASWRGRLAVETNGKGDLVFNAVIDRQLYPVFVLRYGHDDGNYVIILRNEQGRSADVSFDMLSAPAELEGRARDIFYEVQEILPEITASMTLR